jgi:hypothetical protein
VEVVQGVRFYSIEETAKILGVTKRTLYNWNWKNHAGRSGSQQTPILRPVTSPSGRKFFREDEIITALSQCWGIEVTAEGLQNPLHPIHA